MEKMRRYLPTLSIIVALLLGAYLRLYRISEYMTFLGDEGRDMLVVKRMIVDHKFTLLGPTASVGGFFLGPIYYYFMLPFVWAWGLSPVGAAFMVALFGVGTIYLLYVFIADVFDRVTASIAASLYAVSPLVIAYSRSSWNPNLVPFFSIGFFYLLFKSVERKKMVYLFFSGICLGIGLQLHYLFLFLIPVAIFWLLLFARRIHSLRAAGFGIAGFFVGYGPFLAFELRHGFPNTISIIRFLREGTGTGFSPDIFVATVGDVLYRLFGRLLFRLPPPEQWVNLSGFTQVVWDSGIKFSILSSVILFVVYVIGWLKTPWDTQKSKRREASWFSGLILLAFWLTVPLFLFGFYKKGIYDYYFGIFFAVPFVFLAFLLRAMAKSTVGAVFSVCILGALVWFNWQGRPFAYTPNNQLGQTIEIAEAAFEKTGGKPFNFALITGGNSDHAYRYFFEIWGNSPITIENTSVDPQRTTVTDQLIVICESQQCLPLGNSLWEIAGFGRAEIVGEWQVSFVKILKLVHYNEEQP